MKRIPADDKEIALWIQSYNRKMGYSPTIREIGEAFGMKSPSTAQIALNRLIAAKLVKVQQPRRRQLKVNMRAVKALP